VPSTPTIPRRRWIITGGVVAAVLLAGGITVPLLSGNTGTPDRAAAATTPSATASATTAPVPTIAPAALAALPEAKYDAVVAGLIGVRHEITTATVSHLTADAPLFGSDRSTPVARLAAKDFLGQSTTVVGIRTDGAWTLVLTPARQSLPSASGSAGAPAQTSAWVPTSYLTGTTTPDQRVVISTTKQTIEIVDADGTVAQSFPAAVGTPNTPTPTNVTGYLEQRYVDPAQGTGDYPIQLTSLHSSAADEPYGGSDGGLIGVHWYAEHSGAVSHGCVRLAGDALNAVNALPLGTLVTVE
jgi:lipoprotein-anchoring transpeptidase ErfK/SrfK